MQRVNTQETEKERLQSPRLNIAEVEKRMEQQEMSKNTLAESICASKRTIQRVWKNPDDIKLSRVKDIADALHCDALDLII